MSRWGKLGQRLQVRLTCADTAGFLSYIAGLGIKMSDICYLDDLTVCGRLPGNQFVSLEKAAEKKGVALKVLKVSGPTVRLKRLLHRPILIAGMALLLFLSWFIPGRVLFIRIEGNGSIPAAEILEAAEECGIHFGASRRAIRSEQIKNHLLTCLPQLEWAGVNTYGCVAVISVSPRTEIQKKEEGFVSGIVAQRDGVITNCTVTAGTALCVPGQAVKKGDLLISGYTDTGLHIRAEQARGEIFAATSRQLTVVSPLIYSQKGDISHTDKKFSLLLGKKRINFFKDSGISPPSCDKMYSEYYLVLPGGFQLPIGLAVEQTVFYEQPQYQVDTEYPEAMAKEFAENYLLSQMISGRLLHTAYTADTADEIYILHTRSACLEMIGRQRIEENFNSYGEND